MGRRNRWDRKTASWGMTAFLFIALGILLSMAFSHVAVLKGLVLGGFRILRPFVWGLGIAWLLLPLMRQAEKGLFLPLCSRLHGGGRKLARGLSVLLAELALLSLLAAFGSLLLPQLYRSLESLVRNGNIYLAKLSLWLAARMREYPELASSAGELLLELNTGLVDTVRSTLLPALGALAGNVTTGVYHVLRVLYHLVIGLIVSAYVLARPESLAAGAGRLLISLCGPQTAEKVGGVLALINRSFLRYFGGMLPDSALVGLMCYMGCVVLELPYALLLSVLVGIANLIPFFGPVLGAVPCTLLLLMVSPPQCPVFLLLLLALQLANGCFLRPRLLGSSLRLSGFWAMPVLVLGAGFFGFWGMLLGLPAFLVLRRLLDGCIGKKLKKSDLPEEVTAYMNLLAIDPITHEPVKRGAQE